MAGGIDDLSDSTDWLQTVLPQLAPLEAALRCQVCKDFFTTPVLTSCSHTFCSLCIRKCLSSDSKCPACRATDQDSKLRRNWAVEDAVEAFKRARQSALDLATRAAEDAAAAASPSASKGGRQGKAAARKRKLDETDIEDETASRASQTRRTRSQAKKEATTSSQEASAIEVLDSEDEADNDYQPEDGLVPCPICNKRMKEEAVFRHLDGCTGEQEKQSAGRNSRIKPDPPQAHPLQLRKPQQSNETATRLPQLSYGLLNDNALRKKLQQLGIPAWGSRQLLIRRHTEWVNIWNSNCDSSHPRTKRELLRDLDVWERSQGGHAAPSTSTVTRKDFDGQGWAEANKDQFADLIAQARRKRPSPAEKMDESASSEKPDAPQQAEGGDNSVLPDRSSSFTVAADHSPAVSQPMPSNSHPNPPARSHVVEFVPGSSSAPAGLPADAAPNDTSLTGHLFTSPVKKMPMFTMSEEVARDVDMDVERGSAVS